MANCLPSGDHDTKPASEAFAHGEHAQASEHFTAALEMGGLNADQFVDSHIRRAVCRARVGDTAGAHADLDYVADHAPNPDLVHSARAFVLQAEGKSAEAAAMLANARRLNRHVETFGKQRRPSPRWPP